MLHYVVILGQSIYRIYKLGLYETVHLLLQILGEPTDAPFIMDCWEGLWIMYLELIYINELLLSAPSPNSYKVE